MRTYQPGNGRLEEEAAVLLLLLLEEEKYLLDEWVDLGWRWIDVGLSPFIYIHIHIKATDE